MYVQRCIWGGCFYAELVLVFVLVVGGVLDVSW
jgi:hypothetical protein